VVIGAGHNGLAAACLLARAGRRVVVLEERERVGGLCASDEFHPRFRAPGLLADTHLVRHELLSPLELERHGLRLARSPREVLFTDGEGPGLLLSDERGFAASELRKRAPGDLAPFTAWSDLLDRVRPAVRALLAARPPRLHRPRGGELLALARSGLGLRRLGAEPLRELLRMLPLSAADAVGERFEDPLLAAGLAGAVLPGTSFGPRGAGGGALLLAERCAAGVPVLGGPAALTNALERCAQSLGVEVRTGMPAARIVVEDGAALGVQLTGGAVLAAHDVLATCDPHRALLELLPAESWRSRDRDSLRRWRQTGDTAVLRLALARPPAFVGREGEQVSAARVVRDVAQQERAVLGLHLGEPPAEPWLDVHVPSAHDPALAPAGAAVLTALVPGVPAERAGGWTPEARDELQGTCLAALEAAAPGVRDDVLAAQLLLPTDVEERAGVRGGHLLHGEPALDQSWFLRPSLACGRYTTPVRGLWLGGSGSSPGGGVTAAPGALAARTILDAR
jgi:phytoene dehydrogenase-like protein